MYANSYVLHHLLSWTCVFSSSGYSCAASYTQFENLASTTASFILDCFRIQTEMKFRSAAFTGPCTLRCSPAGRGPPCELKTTTTSKWHACRLSKQPEMFSFPLNLSFLFLCLEPCKTPTASFLRMTARERFRTLKAS